MEEYYIQIRRTMLQTGLLALAEVAGTFPAGAGSLAAGFLVGNIASIAYYLMLCRRIKRCAQMPLAKAVTYMRTGWLLRLFFITLVLLISVRFPQIDFRSAVVGLFSVQIVMFANSVFQAGKTFVTQQRKF